MHTGPFIINMHLDYTGTGERTSALGKYHTLELHTRGERGLASLIDYSLNRVRYASVPTAFYGYFIDIHCLPSM